MTEQERKTPLANIGADIAATFSGSTEAAAHLLTRTLVGGMGNPLAGIVLQKIRDHGPYAEEHLQTWGTIRTCHWCGYTDKRPHAADCLWRDIEKATDRPGDDLGLPGGLRSYDQGDAARQVSDWRPPEDLPGGRHE